MNKNKIIQRLEIIESKANKEILILFDTLEKYQVGIIFIDEDNIDNSQIILDSRKQDTFTFAELEQILLTIKAKNEFRGLINE